MLYDNLPQNKLYFGVAPVVVLFPFLKNAFNSAATVSSPGTLSLFR